MYMYLSYYAAFSFENIECGVQNLLHQYISCNVQPHAKHVSQCKITHVHAYIFGAVGTVALLPGGVRYISVLVYKL